jgi:O-glycosyl hydrolase
LKDWKPVLRDGKPIIETLDWSVFRRVGKWAQTLKQEYPDLYVIASAWSPPAWMKRPNKKYGITMTSMGGSFNTQYARHYGKFLVEWARLMQKEFGVEVKALSIQNEPLFFEPYDSCQYKRDGSDYHTVYKAVTEEFAKAAVPMKFFINEDMLRFPNRVMDMIKPVLDDPDLLPTVAAVATHGYLDGVQMDADPKSGAALYDMVHPYGKETWLSEFGGGWSLEWIRNNPDKRGRGILHDIGFGMTGFLGYNNASLVAIWQLWNGKEEKVLTPILGNPDEGYILSRKAHALKHFTKYIRPGMYRVDTGEVLRNGWACMAFSDKAGRERLTIELVSKRKSDLMVSIALRNHTAERFAVYRTSADEGHVRRRDAIVEQGYVRVMLPKESIVSLVYGG